MGVRKGCESREFGGLIRLRLQTSIPVVLERHPQITASKIIEHRIKEGTIEPQDISQVLRKQHMHKDCQEKHIRL